MRRVLIWIVGCLVLAGAAVASERPQGLMWNRTGLPATIPLQIKTVAGADYLLRLKPYEEIDFVFAAYIRGGDFFRVLVPPGRFDLVFASGADWQGEAVLFGADTAEFLLDPPLVFKATATRREGYLIDLRDPQQITLRSLATCDRRAVDPDSLRSPTSSEDRVIAAPERTTLPERPDKIPFARYEVQTRFCD
jgi:hypothetical protein